MAWRFRYVVGWMGAAAAGPDSGRPRPRRADPNLTRAALSHGNHASTRTTLAGVDQHRGTDTFGRDVPDQRCGDECLGAGSTPVYGDRIPVRMRARDAWTVADPMGAVHRRIALHPESLAGADAHARDHGADLLRILARLALLARRTRGFVLVHRCGCGWIDGRGGHRPWLLRHLLDRGSAAPETAVAAALKGCTTEVRTPRHPAPWHPRTRLCPRHLLEQRDVLEDHPGTDDYGRQRVLGDQDRQARLLAQTPIEVAQHRPAAGEHHAAVVDVGAQFGWDPLERVEHGLRDLPQRLGKRLANLLVADHHGSRHTLRDMTSFHFHLQLLVERRGRTELPLDLLRRPLADQQVAGLLQIIDDRVRHRVTGDPQRASVDRPRHRDYGDIGRSAADVDDHVAGWIGDRQTSADCRGHRFVDEMHLTRLRAKPAVFDRSAFDRGDFRWHANKEARPDHGPPAVSLADEMREHLFGGFEVGDDAVLHGSHRLDVRRRPSEHLVGFLPNGLDFPLGGVEGNDRRFIDDDPAAAREHAGVGGAEIDGDICGEAGHE